MDPKNLTILLSIGIPAYLMIGFVIGIILKYRTARHLWTAHGMTVRPFRVLEIDCWCKWENMGGDLVFAAPYVSFLLWPIILAALIVSIPFTLHAKVFKVVTKLAQHDAPLKGIPGVGGRVQISAHDELQTLYNQLLEKCQGLQAMLAEQTKSLDGYRESMMADGYVPSYRPMRNDVRGPDLAPRNDCGYTNCTVEEEFRKRAGRELGEDLKEPKA